MANPGTVNPSNMINEAGLDQITANSRTRATLTQPLGVNWINGYGTPISLSLSASTVLTASQLLTGIITVSITSGQTITFDTAANIVSGVNAISAGAVIGDVVQCLICNGGASTFTLASGTGNAFDSHQTNTTMTGGASKFVYVRLNSVSSGSESTTIYF